MATSNCLFTTYCVQNTGFPEWDDTYVRTGTFNDNSYYIGQTNGYVIFFSSEGYWCLADYIDGTCFLSGKKPCYTICPDLCEDYFTRGICPPPVPDPVQACDTFDFDAYFDCDVQVTPTQTPTNTSTPTPTPTVTSTNFCPIYVNASIQSFTPTPTSTPAITPSSTGTINRGCGFMGDVTFNTINTTILCSFSLEFQDCYNGSRYYTTNTLSNPGGGVLEQFMIFQATIDGKRACISYVGVNNDIIGGNNIVFVSGLIGYSNLGQCASCLEILTPTPTPTPSITPTITLTSSSNKPAPPPASNTPTPTKTRTVLYYTYQQCGTNVRICQPVPAVEGLLVNQTFKVGPFGPYRDTCWSLHMISTFCQTMNPNYETLVFNTNQFPSVVNNTFSDCTKCATNSSSSIPPAVSNSPTPTPTPTKTKAPQSQPVQACKPHLVRWANQDGVCGVCFYPSVPPVFSIPTEATWYSPSDTLIAGSQVYLNSTCTSPVPAFRYFKALSSSGVVVSPTLITFGSGIISIYPCTICN